MFSKEDLILKYESFSEDELFEVYSNIDSYSDDAKQALHIVLDKKGGIENLKKHQEQKRIILNEIQRINNEVIRLSKGATDILVLKKLITSKILSYEELSEVIDAKHAELELQQEDVKIKPRTIIGCMIGGCVASIIGGILWALQMIYTQRMFLALFVALILLCYGIIKVFTKQSNKNTAVHITIITSVLIALLIGQLLYNAVGYRG